MLKVKFWRVENVLLMKVLEQGDEIERGNFRFEASNGIIFESCETPSLPFQNENRLCIRGEDTECDNDIVVHRFKSNTVAKQFLNRYIEAIKEYNDPYQELEDEDMEIIVAE